MVAYIYFTGFGDEFFKTSESGIEEDKKASLQAYKSVLNTKGTEETLVRDIYGVHT